MLSQVHTLALCGVEAQDVLVEVDLAGGLPLFDIVGLPDASVRESRNRVRAALRNSGFGFPSGRVTVNLAPAHMPKAGPAFDLPIAVALLAAWGRLPPACTQKSVFAGELALDGRLRSVQGAVCLATAHVSPETPELLVLPTANQVELALMGSTRQLQLADTLFDVVAWLQGRSSLQPVNLQPEGEANVEHLDLQDVIGQTSARRALEIAAAGRHNLLLVGPPGTGKTMLAARLPSILPPPTEAEALEIARVYSAAGLLGGEHSFPLTRPFRAPHHTITPGGMIGGGTGLRPGEVTLAHHGVLFLDEFSEFRTDVLCALREPIEEGWVRVTRGMRSARFPADFQLVAATNPCPCGWQGDSRRRCSCTDGDLHRYRRRMNGPLLDRIDMFVALQSSVEFGSTQEEQIGESSAAIADRVRAAWQRQLERAMLANSRLSPRDTRQHCGLDDAGVALLQSAVRRQVLTGRGVDRVLRVARTIADLNARDHIALEDVAEALSYRQ